MRCKSVQYRSQQRPCIRRLLLPLGQSNHFHNTVKILRIKPFFSWRSSDGDEPFSSPLPLTHHPSWYFLETPSARLSPRAIQARHRQLGNWHGCILREVRRGGRFGIKRVAETTTVYPQERASMLGALQHPTSDPGACMHRWFSLRPFSNYKSCAFSHTRNNLSGTLFRLFYQILNEKQKKNQITSTPHHPFSRYGYTETAHDCSVVFPSTHTAIYSNPSPLPPPVLISFHFEKRIPYGERKVLTKCERTVQATGNLE